MRKSIAVIGLFFVLAAVALVYGIQYIGSPQSIQGGVTHPLPIGPVTTVDPNTVPSVHTASGSNIEFQWKLGNPYLLRNSSGDVFLDLRVSGKALPNMERKKMNLVLVIDRSGSMASENKLEQVKDAALQVINNMNPTDLLSIVIYDDSVQTLLSSSPVESKERVRELIYGLSPGGSTNLHGGLMQGYAEAKRNFRQDCVNRILLLSDGLANAGVVDPNAIATDARRIRDNSISVSAMGVGLDYNENLMANIADNSGGNYYFINTDMNMAEVFKNEWNLMQSLVAKDGKATIQLGKGVQVVEVSGYQWEQNSGKLTVHVPDIYSGQTRRILVELRAPSDAIRTVNLGSGAFECMEITGDTPRKFAATFSPTIRIVEDRTIVAGNMDQDVNAKAASNIATRKMEQAYQYMEAGEKDKAYEMAVETRDQLEALGYVGNTTQVQRYDDAVKVMAPEAQPAPSSTGGKVFLKKQKEAERKAQQSNPQ